MSIFSRSRRLTYIALILTLILSSALSAAVFVFAAGSSPVQLSSDPYTNTTSQHQTEVEPDSFSNGSTIVTATQVGRFSDGGASNIGWATSTDNGITWKNGFLPGTTVYATPAGQYERVSDPSVAYDAAHHTWMISSLAISTATGSPVGAAVLVSLSSDGGLTWGPALGTANHTLGLGGQPVVQPNGTVVVPIINAFETTMLSFVSTNGGASWSITHVISDVRDHANSGGLRTSPLPSAETDAAGNVYVAWQDCRFRRGCSSNDIVLSKSSDGVHWSGVSRVPIDPVTSGADHFIPGLGVDPSTSGASAHLGLTYHFYPSAACTAATCQLDVGFISSTNGGATWSTSTQLAGPMTLSWLASTNQGPMVGDYIATSILAGQAWGPFAVASAPSGGLFDEAMFVPTGGLPVTGGSNAATDPVVSTSSDHPASTAPPTY